MRRKKDNKISTLAIFALILTIIALILTSGTYAKYTGSIQSTKSTATVAKFDVIINSNSESYKLGVDTSFPFNLFTTIKEEDGSANESHVKSGRIAPGTSGSFSFSIVNNSEVDIQYGISLAPDDNNSNVPLVFSAQIGDGTPTEYVALADLDFSSLFTHGENRIAKESSSSPVNVTLYWKWLYENGSTPTQIQTNDTNDTNVGNYGEDDDVPTYAVTATVTATQVH